MKRNLKINLALLALVLGAAIYTGCKDGLASFLSLDQDIQLGQQLDTEINSDPSKYTVLSRSDSRYAWSYQYLDNMRDQILATGASNGSMNHRNEFPWKLTILRGNELNAFCAPGGYMYVYTGLIQYLDQPDDLAGVLGHEMAHADRRHTSKSMVQQYGLQFVLDLLLGENRQQLSQVAGGLIGLQFSRDHEKDADKYSVRYLNGSNYACNGAASFFAKLIASGQGSGTPAFLSTHPDPGNRVSAINGEASTQGCSTSGSGNTADWQRLKRELQ